ncbi:snoRNA-binding rRNA-processing protein imp4 [Dinochytrium kinnereticum]|nr:snoRNA-binding rRNA-processing protein imp4 [Dinochytrium kinnereticum]
MIRKETRKRREYLYRKSLEVKDRQIYERKQKLKEAIAENKTLSADLRKDIDTYRKEVFLDEGQAEPTNHIDDEYSTAGMKDPKVLITTSRDPSSRLLQFSKEMRLVFPNAQRINRGGYVIKEVCDACRANDVTDLIILHEHRGKPDGLVISHFPYGPTAYFSLHNVVLRHDIPDRGTVSEQFPHLIFNNFNTKLGLRVQNILKYLFPVPKEESKRVMTYSQENDFISFRHHVFAQSGKDVELMEVGPRFEMRAYEIKLGTVDIASTADTEWVHRPYSNAAKKGRTNL